MGPAETVVVLLHLLISGTIGLIGLFAADIYVSVGLFAELSPGKGSHLCVGLALFPGSPPQF